ncbi:PQQ-dependent sugar dehydrogenase [Vibrio sp. NH-7]
MKIHIYLALSAIGAVLSTSVYAWQAELVASGLKVPWGMSSIDDNQLLVTQRHGEVGVVDLDDGIYRTVATPTQVSAVGQGGLLDVAKSPFEDNAFYFTYSKQVEDAYETVLASAQYQQGELIGWKELLVTQSGSDTGRHFGSRITFDERYVYMSVGDRGVRDNGQNQKTHAGSILRLLPNGVAPEDNPFTKVNSALNEIWSYGHRNPQGLFYDRSTQQLWSIEHGPRGGDEINLILKGENYGWPVTSHGKEYWGPISVGEAKTLPGIQTPKKVYVPSIAPSSIILYRGDKYPSLNGKLVSGALKLTHLNVVTLDEKANIVAEERLLESLGERIRDLEVTPSGEILFSTDSGNIYRLVE